MSDKPPRRWYAAADIIHNAYTAWVVLLLSLIVTLGAYVVSVRVIEQRQSDRFEFSAYELEKAIKSHLSVYEQVLRSTVALVYSTGHLDRSTFATFVRSLELNEYWPGIQGIGYSVPLQPSELEAHTQAIRDEGFPEYAIKPSGDRTIYSAIVYLEPFDWRNRRAFGYDMYSNEVRRIAMDRARATGEASISGKITLVQETDQNVQYGFLTYMPVYRTRTTPYTEAQRLEQFEGWVYAAFRAGDLMNGVTGGDALMLEYEIYDGATVEPAALLYSSHGRDVARTGNIDLVAVRQIELQGRPWTLRVTPADGFAQSVEHADLPQYVAVGGVIIDLLLFYVILSLHFIRQKAEAIAEQRTRQLRTTQEDLELQRVFANAVIDSLPLVLFVREYKSDTIMRINPYTRNVFGVNSAAGGELLNRFVARVENQSRLAGVDSRADYMAQLDVETQTGTRWFTVSRTSIDNGRGDQEYSLCAAIDITDRLESEKRFTTLFDSAPCGLMLVRSDQTIQLANRALCELFGYGLEELPGNEIGILVPQDLRAGHGRQVAAYSLNPYQRKMSSRSSLKGVTKDGRELILDIALQPLNYDNQGYVLVSVADITKQHNLVQQLERANRYKSEFLASMSHELRTPLNSIIGFTERVLKGAGVGLGERERDGLDTVQRNAHHLLALINDILDLSKVEAGRMEVDWEHFDLCKLLDVQLQVLTPSAKAKGLHMRVSLPDKPVMITTDRSKLLQILNNMVSNAVKYTQEGKVEVTLELNQMGDGIVLRVTDTGLGIPEVELRSLFKEFVRVKEARQQSIQGTGLGLAICARLAALLGGKISADSRHGYGSTFTLRLPLEQPGPESEQNP